MDAAFLGVNLWLQGPCQGAGITVCLRCTGIQQAFLRKGAKLLFPSMQVAASVGTDKYYCIAVCCGPSGVQEYHGTFNAGTSTAEQPSGCSELTASSKRSRRLPCSPRKATRPTTCTTCSACGTRLSAGRHTSGNKSMGRCVSHAFVSLLRFVPLLHVPHAVAWHSLCRPKRTTCSSCSACAKLSGCWKVYLT